MNINEQNKLKIEYIPLSRARVWDRNKKKHDIGALCSSLQKHGFQDPPRFSAALNNGEGGTVEGNGRLEALSILKRQGGKVPKGIGIDDSGEWYVPFIFGNDFESQKKAEAYAIDHNNLTFMGAEGFSDFDIAQHWDEGYTDILAELAKDDWLPVSIDTEALDMLMTVPDFQPVGADEQPRLDQKNPVICPHCGKNIHDEPEA